MHLCASKFTSGTTRPARFITGVLRLLLLLLLSGALAAAAAAAAAREVTREVPDGGGVGWVRLV
eukprot:CAMPEP_0171623742 /NCGR_PEP_ID=MMETSP0990-20121206/18156_1 /TAXON_ID=483369 /ORGANISM="non described non described, Strain CCMP2098" /LENGTH=63 /DNA_ID=CAMNT_0012190061 /DNA_START=155 /DNA_END=343 /DNA_ORIENTATION=-